jgi:hypothetical protein
MCFTEENVPVLRVYMEAQATCKFLNTFQNVPFLEVGRFYCHGLLHRLPTNNDDQRYANKESVANHTYSKP